MPQPEAAPPEAAQPDTAEREARALRISIAAGAGCAALAVVWGILAGSRVVLFDGVSSSIGLVLSLAALGAARAAARERSRAFPYGRQSFVPVAVGVQGLARFAISTYAIVDAAAIIRGGGDAVPSASILLYAAIVAVVCIAVTVRLGRDARGSDLVAAEALGWRVASMLTIAILAGFGAVALLPAGDLKDTAGLYIDPVLVIVVSLIVLPAPASMVRTMARELLTMSPPPEISEPAREAVLRVCAGFGLPEPLIRMTKTGGRLYVEVDHVVPVGTWTVDQVDALRSQLKQALDSPGYRTWLNVDISTDPDWSAG